MVLNSKWTDETKGSKSYLYLVRDNHCYQLGIYYMPWWATQDRWVMVESSEKTWSTGEGNGKSFQYSCLENPMNSMNRLKDRTLKGAQYATGEDWRNNFRNNKETEPTWKQRLLGDVTGDGSKVQCYKKQCCIGAWNSRSMNQGKLEVVKHEMAWVTNNILGISELKWIGMGKFNSGDH